VRELLKGFDVFWLSIVGRLQRASDPPFPSKIPSPETFHDAFARDQLVVLIDGPSALSLAPPGIKDDLLYTLPDDTRNASRQLQVSSAPEYLVWYGRFGRFNICYSYLLRHPGMVCLWQDSLKKSHISAWPGKTISFSNTPWKSFTTRSRRTTHSEPLRHETDCTTLDFLKMFSDDDENLADFLISEGVLSRVEPFESFAMHSPCPRNSSERFDKNFIRLAESRSLLWTVPVHSSSLLEKASMTPNWWGSPVIG